MAVRPVPPLRFELPQDELTRYPPTFVVFFAPRIYLLCVSSRYHSPTIGFVPTVEQPYALSHLAACRLQETLLALSSFPFTQHVQNEHQLQIWVPSLPNRIRLVTWLTVYLR